MTKNGLESKLPNSVVLLLCPLLLTATISLKFSLFLGYVQFMYIQDVTGKSTRNKGKVVRI